MTIAAYAKLDRSNFRGLTTDALVYDLQDIRDWLEFEAPHEEDWDSDDEQHAQRYTKDIVAEIERRGKIQYDGMANTNKEIIQTIKNSVKIEAVLEWYTEVFLHKRTWTYRCRLHGEDKNPSGVIYPEEQKFHCFGCSKGGDIFDAVQMFERLTLPQAINKLARHIGIDTKPITRKPLKGYSL